MKNIVETLFESNLNILINTFKATAYEVFYDHEKKGLIHPGEYGNYRESLLREFLVSFLPDAYGVSQGFIVSPTGEVSNQCDIIIYSKSRTPIIKTPEAQRFFPIESVVGVIEVKSVIDTTILRDAQNKLCKVKNMRANIERSAIAYQEPYIGRYDPENNLRDQIGTFIVAESISCSREKVKEVFTECPKHEHRVNLLVSLSDYCITYKNGKKSFMYPVDLDNNSLSLRFEIPTEPSIPEHLKLFFRYLLMVIQSTTILSPELTHYFGNFKYLKSVE